MVGQNCRLKELSQSPGAGRVLVVDAGGSVRNAVMGDMIAGDFAANGRAGLAIRLGEARVAPGSFLVADEDGAVVFPPGLAPPAP